MRNLRGLSDASTGLRVFQKASKVFQEASRKFKGAFVTLQRV